MVFQLDLQVKEKLSLEILKDKAANKTKHKATNLKCIDLKCSAFLLKSLAIRLP